LEKIPTSSSLKSILVVDDDHDIVGLIRRLLERHGYNIVGFTDPIAALKHFELDKKRFGLVISDIRMPQMNGYELVKRVKTLKPETKVILMSAFEINREEFSKSTTVSQDRCIYIKACFTKASNSFSSNIYACYFKVKPVR
jgi:CheY-like chemotaxis protein